MNNAPFAFAPAQVYDVDPTGNELMGAASVDISKLKHDTATEVRCAPCPPVRPVRCARCVCVILSLCRPCRGVRALVALWPAELIVCCVGKR